MASSAGSRYPERRWPKATSSQLSKIDSQLLKLHDRGLSANQIGERLGWASAFISMRLRACGRFGRNYRFFTEFTPRQRSILVGTLLGDGSLTMGRHNAHAGLYLGHGSKQRDYLIWKAKEFGSLFNTLEPHEQAYDNGAFKYALQSRKHPVFTEYYNSTVRKGMRRRGLNAKRITPSLLKQVDALALAIWWADDGGCDTRNALGTSFHMAVGGATPHEYALVERWFFDQGFPVRRYPDPERSCCKFWMQREVSARFESRITPYLPTCIRYKLRLSNAHE